jgi:hypothetical protein
VRSSLSTGRPDVALAQFDVPFRADGVSSRMNANSLAVSGRNMSMDLVGYA